MFPTRVFKGLLEAHLRFDIAASVELLSLVLRTGLIFPSFTWATGSSAWRGLRFLPACPPWCF